MKTLLPPLFISLFVGACAMPTIRALPTEPEKPTPAVSEQQPGWASQPHSEPQLYARDGSIVGEQEPGTIATSPNAGQTAAVGEGSRWTLLEQYQEAVEEREELEIEVQGLNAALDRGEEQELELLTELDQLRELMARYESRIEQLEGETVELAARLTTAQIRRLQAEKLLLESKLLDKSLQATMTDPTDTSDAVESGSPVPPTNPRRTPPDSEGRP